MSFWRFSSKFSTPLFVLGVVTLALISTVATSQPPLPSGIQPWKGSAEGWTQDPGSTKNVAVAANRPVVGAAGDVIGFSNQDDLGTQTITLVDTSKFWMAVYHIDRSGEIRLVSSRPLEADFSLQLNVTAPFPDNIRQLGRR